MVHDSDMLDGTISESEVNLKWAATVSKNPKGVPNQPERGLIRYFTLSFNLFIFTIYYIAMIKKILNDANVV
jgi:hypothetical protein